jgi:hypothetical protein
MKKFFFLLLLIILSCSSPTKSEIPPSAVQITTIAYNENVSLVIDWSKSTDKDFSKYTLLGSYESNLNSPEVLFETTDINTTSFTFNIDSSYNFPKYFSIRTTNKSGLSTIGPIGTNEEIQKFKQVYDTRGIIRIIKKLNNGGVLIGIKGKEDMSYRSLVKKLNIRLGVEKANYVGRNAFETNSDIFITDLVELQNGNILVSGFDAISGQGFIETFPPDINNVNIIWYKTFDSISSEVGFKIHELDNGELITVGKQDFIKIDINGNIVLKEKIDSLSECDLVYDVMLSDDKSFYYVLGTKKQYQCGTSARRIFIAKLDLAGNTISSNSYGIRDQIVDPHGIYSDNSGNYYISYSVQGSASNHRILTIDNNANPISDVELSYDIHPNLSFNEDSFIGMSGSSGDVTTINIHKFDLSGNLLSTISHTLDRRMNLGAIVAFNNEFLVGGSLNSYTSREYAFILRIDQNGNNSKFYLNDSP